MITDLQQSGWDAADQGSVPERVPVEVEEIGGPDGNVAVTALRVEGTEAIAFVQNFANRPVVEQVTFTIDSEPAGAVPLTIAANGSGEARLTIPGSISGALSASISDGQGYVGDNTRFAVLDPATAPLVLAVTASGHPSESFYLERALAIAQGAGGFRFRAVGGPAFSDMKPQELDAVRVVAILGTRGLEQRGRELLAGYVRAGGGLLVTAGPDVDAAIVRQALQNLVETSWRPREGDPLRFAPVDSRHPVFRVFGGVGTLANVSFTRSALVEPGASADVVARYSDGTPALVEEAAGEGRVLVFSSDLNNAWNDFPLQPAFVPFLHESLRHLAAARHAATEYLVGALPGGAGRTPGVVDLTGRRVAVNVDPRESDSGEELHGGVQDEHLGADGGRRAGGRGRAGQREDGQRLWQVRVAAHGGQPGGRGNAGTEAGVMGEHYSELSRLLARVRNRWRAVAVLRAWTLAAAAASLVLALALVTQQAVAPDGFAMVALWLVAAVVVLASVGWTIVLLRRAPGDRQIARFIEECCPELEDALVTAIAERGAGGERRLLAEAVVGDAVRRTRALDVDRIVSMRALRGVALRAGAATLVLLILGWFSVAPAGRAARVLALYLFPESLIVDVTPGDVKLRAGQSLKIVVKLTGGVPGLVPVLRTGEGGGLRETRMEPDADRFALSFDDVDEGFEYSVTAAATTTRDYTVTVIRPPRVEQIDLRDQYPKAFGMEPRQEEDGGDIYGPAGTVVRLSIHTDKPVTDAALTLGNGKRIALAGDGARSRGRAHHRGRRLVSRGPAGCRWPEEPGRNRVSHPHARRPAARCPHHQAASDRKVTPIEEVTIDARADDDFGVARSTWSTPCAGKEQVVPFASPGSGLTVNGDHTIYLEDLHVAARRLRDLLRARAGREPRQALTEARSDIFFLEVKPFEEEFVAAQSQGGAGSQDERSIEDLVESQKEIITATWKLDRRAPQDTVRHRSEDIKTISKRAGRARGRVRSGAAGRCAAPTMFGAACRGAGRELPDRVLRRRDGPRRSPRWAVLQEELEALSTPSAMPHEMAALNELLQARG